ncbi:hypothetical protein QL285_026135 [Trifolium repens]|nr:hypothetical protein QL285_026135 [Trifolium repens]
MLFEKKESENENEEITEKEIQSLFVVIDNATIPTYNVSMASCTLESLSQIEVNEENRNSTFERSKEEEETREKKNECDEKEIYERKINEEFEEDDNFKKIQEKKFNLQKEREYPKEKICFTNQLVIYASSDLRTNPLEKGHYKKNRIY